jgi:hypothetical protein
VIAGATGETIMKSVIIGSALAIVIAVVAGIILTSMGSGTAEVYSTGNVRL